jgi:TalC/MipB family fructose-6-phosphate aldolase
MNVFVDTAVRDDAAALLRSGVFAGVTTNPTLLRRAGLSRADIPDLHRDLLAAGAGTVFLQATGPDAVALATDGRDLAALGDSVVVKVPCTSAGLEAATALRRDGVPVLLTAVYSAAQALLAQQVGAAWIAPYVGRMTDAGRDGIAETLAIQQICARSGVTVLAASLRSLADVATLAANGVGAFALAPGLARRLVDDDLSVAAAVEFERAARGDLGSREVGPGGHR